VADPLLRGFPSAIELKMLQEDGLDSATLRAMAKWPDVPAVFGWLSLDARGVWRIRGQAVTHPLSLAVIAENYSVGPCGCWFFQNGPQRVFVNLNPTPWVFKFQHGEWRDHTGVRIGEPRSVWLDEEWQMYWQTADKFGIVDDRDLVLAASFLHNGKGETLGDAGDSFLNAEASESACEDLWFTWRSKRIPVGFVSSETLPATFGFVASPQPDLCGGSA